MLTYLQNESGPKHEKDFQMFKTQTVTSVRGANFLSEEEKYKTTSKSC